MTTPRKFIVVVGAVVVAAVTATAIATRGGASSDSTTLSNTGVRRVDIRRVVIRSVPIRSGSLLGVRAKRAFYRLDRPSAGPCFGAGPASDIGNVGSITCPRGGFPRAGDPVLDFSVYESTRHDMRNFSLFRIEGFAADGVAAVEFLRPNGTVAVKVPVSANVYATTEVPDGAIAGFAAVDEAGKRVGRSPYRSAARSRLVLS
jgi:hypothetical protein